MRKLILVSLFFISCNFTFGQNELNNLEKAFKAKSQTQYKQFLSHWKDESQPLKTYDSLPNIHKDIYEIFTDFYDPFNLKKIGSGEFGEKLYSKVSYVVVQNRIYAYTFKTDDIDYNDLSRNDSLIISKDSIIDFRPNVTFNKAQTLFLTPKYDTIINIFLGNSHYPLGTGGIMNPARAKGSSERRVNFLNKELVIIYGHWGGYWHIESHPYVFNIDFNKDHTKARVHYRLVYQGGEADYYKKNGKWVFKSAGLTWIE